MECSSENPFEHVYGCHSNILIPCGESFPEIENLAYQFGSRYILFFDCASFERIFLLFSVTFSYNPFVIFGFV